MDIHEDDVRREVLVKLAQTMGDIDYWRGPRFAPMRPGARGGAMTLAQMLLHDDLTDIALAVDEEYDPTRFAKLVAQRCVFVPKNLERRAEWARNVGRMLDKELFGG